MRKVWSGLFVAAAAFVVAGASFASAGEVRFAAPRVASTSVLHDIRLSSDKAFLELSNGVLYEDDGPAAGFSYKPNEETLGPHVLIKKELLISDPRAAVATVLVGTTGAIQATINGHPQTLTNRAKAGNYWTAYNFSPACLREGKNEIVLRGEGKIWIARDDEFAAGSVDRTRHPNRSAKSTDGGQTWDYDHLGARGDVDGEYCVRVFLDQFRSAGSVMLPVIDVGNLPDAQNQTEPIATALSSIGPVKVTAMVEAGHSGKIVLQLRTGKTIMPDASNWSAWEELETEKDVEAKNSGEVNATVRAPVGRFVQLKVLISTTDALQSPLLKSVTIASTPVESPQSAWRKQVKVIELQNEQIVRSSIPFQYEPFTQPRLQQLRKSQAVDDITAGAKSEFELICRLAKWSSTRWKSGHLKDVYPAWDAVDILQSHSDGTPVGGFCQQYNLVLLQSCESYGLVGRVVSMGAGPATEKIRSGHEAVEIWSNEFNKWIYVDGNAAWYFTDKENDVPLSLRELRDRQMAAFAGGPANAVRIVRLAESPYEWQDLKSWPAFTELRLIPRSNFLEQRSPLPLNQGMRGWFWTGHFAWTDNQSTAPLLYGNRVANSHDWDWTLNQTHFELEATNTPGELRIHLDTETPGFETFVATMDDRSTQEVKTGFVWKLHQGRNSLALRSRNRARREGIKSQVVIEYAE